MPDISHLLYKSEEEKDEGLCHIQTVLNKYLFDYDEFKRRQKEQGLSQTIDVSTIVDPNTIDVSRSVALPPLKTPKMQRRVTLNDNFQRYMT